MSVLPTTKNGLQTTQSQAQYPQFSYQEIDDGQWYSHQFHDKNFSLQS